MKVNLFACAEMVLLDSQSQKISLINLIENAVAASYPLLAPNFYVVISASKEDGDPETIEGAIEFRRDGEVIFGGPASIAFLGLQRAKSIVQIQGVLINEPCRLDVVLVINGEEKGIWETTFDVAPHMASNPLESVSSVRS